MALEVTPAREETRRLVASKFPQFLAAFFATLSALAAGAAIAWSSPVLPLLQGAHIITEEQAALVGALITLGAFVGALPAGALADIVGRKGLLVLSTLPMLVSWAMVSLSDLVYGLYTGRLLAGLEVLSTLPMMVSWALVSFSGSVYGLYTGRLLAGLGVGLVSVAAPMYISEIAEDAVRGTLGTFFQLQLTVGVLFVYVVGLLRNALSISLVCSSLPLAFICTFVWMPETPSYLLTKGHDNAAGEALQWLRGFHYNIQPELGALQEAVRVSREHRGTLGDLLAARATTRALVVSLGLMAFQQLSAINAVIFYTQPIFEAVGNSMDPTVCTIVIGGVQVLATYASTVLIERAGRRGLLLLSSSTMSLCLALLGLYFLLHDHGLDLPTGLPLAFLAVFIFVFSLGFGPVPWVVAGELFPDSLKGLASSFAASVSWLLAFNVTYFFNILKSEMGYGFTFCIFSGFCLFGTIFVAILLPETKGKSFDTIQRLLRGEKIFDQDKLQNTDTLSRLL